LAKIESVGQIPVEADIDDSRLGKDPTKSGNDALVRMTCDPLMQRSCGGSMEHGVVSPAYCSTETRGRKSNSASAIQSSALSKCRRTSSIT
jgi:hypothetical protein